MKAIVGKYKAPENCDVLCVPRLDKALWSDLEKPAKSRDLALQDVQKCMLSSARPLIEAIQMIKVSCKKKNSNRFEAFIGVFALTCLGNTCSSSLPLTKYLFGDDPSKQVDEISKAIKIRTKVVTKKANSSKRSDRRKPGLRNENRSSGDSFLSDRSGSYRRGRYRQGNSRSSGTTRN